MAVKSSGEYLVEDGEDDGTARKVPCLDIKRLEEGCYKEDNLTAMSEQHGASPSLDDCGVSSEGKCCPKSVETSASQSEDEADGGACGVEKSLSPVLTTCPGQPCFTPKKTKDRNLYSALPSTDFLQPSIVPKTVHDGTRQPLSISTKQQESAQDFLSTTENPYKNSVIGERSRHDRYSDKLLPDSTEYSPVDILTKSKNADDGNTVREHGTNAGAIENPVKDAQERKVSVSSRKKVEQVDTRSKTPKWFFEDDKEFQNWEPSCPDGDSRLPWQVRNKHMPTYRHCSFSIPEKGYPIFRENKKKCFRLDTFLNTKLKEEALACTVANSHTDYDEGFDDKLHRTSKAVIKYSEGGLASNISKHTINESPQLIVGETQLQQKRENRLSGSGLVCHYNAGESLDSEDEEEFLCHFQNKEEDDYLRLHQRKEKPSIKSGSPNTVSTRREQSSCVRQLEKEDASFQSDEIAPQHTFPSTDHCDYDAEAEEYLQNKTLEQGQPVTPRPVVIGKSESASERDFGIEYPRQSDRNADFLTASEEKNKYTNERNRNTSCKETLDTVYIQWPNQTLAEFLHQNQRNARDEEIANATYTTPGARNASEVQAILFPGSTDRNDSTFSAPLKSVKVQDGSDKTFRCRDASLEIQPAQRNDSSDVPKNPNDDTVGCTDDDDYTAAQTDAPTPDMNAQSEHSVLPSNPTPALNEKEHRGAAEHGHGIVSIENVETPSTHRSFESDMPNVDQDQHQGDDKDTSEKEHSAINNVVVYVELTAHVSEHDLETCYNHDESEHVSDGHQEQKHQDNTAGFVLDAEVKKKSAEVLTAEGDKPECDKQYAMMYPRLYEFGDNSSADFQEENDKNRTHDMPVSFGATSVPSNKSSTAPPRIHLNNRNYQNRSDNYLDREGLPAGRHGMLRHQQSPSSRKSSTDVTDTFNSKSTVSDESVSCSDSDVTETEVFSCKQTGKATHCRKAGKHQQEFVPGSDRSDAAHTTPTKSEIIPTQNECIFKPDGNVQKARANKSKLQLSTIPEESSLHDHGDQQSSDAETLVRCDYKLPVPVDFSNKPLVVLKGKKQYSESAVINRRSWQVDGTETTNEYRSLGTWNPSGSDTCFPDHHFLIKMNMKETDIHSNSDQESQSRSSESSDPKLLTGNKIVQEHFGPEEQFGYDKQLVAKKEHLESLDKELLLWPEARLSTVEVPRDKCGVDHILGSNPYLIPPSTDIVVCPAKRDNSPDQPDPASDGENSEGPQDEDDLFADGPQNENQPPPPVIPAATRPPGHQGVAGGENAHGRGFAGEDHIGLGAQNESQRPRHGVFNASLGQPDGEETAGREGEPGRAVICLDLFKPGARGEHQPPCVGIPCTSLRQTDRQGTAAREGEPGGAVICVDRVERGARGERRLPSRGITCTAQPCRCPRCLLVHLIANIGLPAVAVPCPTECRGDRGSDNDVHSAAERSSRPCDVSRFSQAARRILFPGFTCRGHRTQDSTACLDCLNVGVRTNENIRVEQQPCSHDNSSTQSTVEEVDIGVHDRGRLHHCFVAPGHGLFVMCRRHAVNTRLYNCLHRVVCRHCARLVRVCPMCGEPVVCFFVF